MDDSLELLDCIYQNAEMGVSSIKKLIHLIQEKDNKIKSLLEDELKCYEKFYKESKKLLEKNKVDLKKKGVVATLMADVTMQLEVTKDNSDSKIADILTRGLTMGKIDIQKRIDNFKGQVNHNVMKLAKELLKFHDDNIEKVKPYL